MKDVAIVVFLALSVAMAWLGVLGFARLRAPLDRLHCVTFVNVAAGILLLLAAVVADGVSTRSTKIVLIVIINLVGGAAVSHRIGSAILEREAAAK